MFMYKFTAKESSFGFSEGRSYYTADVLKLESNAYSCIISDDRGVRYQISTDVPCVTSNGHLINFDVAEVSSGNVL